MIEIKIFTLVKKKGISKYNYSMYLYCLHYTIYHCMLDVDS